MSWLSSWTQIVSFYRANAISFFAVAATCSYKCELIWINTEIPKQSNDSGSWWFIMIHEPSNLECYVRCSTCQITTEAQALRNGFGLRFPDFLCISHLSHVPFDLFYPNGWAGKDSAHKVNTSRSLTASRAYGCYSAPCVGCRVGGWMFMTLIEIAFWCFLIDATQHCPGKSDSLADLWSLFKPQSLTAYERGLISPVESDHQGQANRQTCKV